MSRKLPTAVHEAKGTARSDRQNPNEPKSAIGEPAMPVYFDEDEKKCWRQIVDVLLPMGVLTQADGAALEQLVICMLECRDLKKQVREAPIVKVTSTQGEAVDRVHPLYTQWNAARDRLMRLWSVFGLDPLARTSLHTVKVTHPEKSKSTNATRKAPVQTADTGRFFAH